MRCKQMQGFAVPAVDIPKRSVADANGVLQHRSKHRLQIAGRAADDLKHLRRGCLLLQRFREVGGALGEVARALAQFVEQPRVLDGDDSLRGEVLNQLDLVVGEGTNVLAVNDKRPDQIRHPSTSGQLQKSECLQVQRLQQRLDRVV